LSATSAVLAPGGAQPRVLEPRLLALIPRTAHPAWPELQAPPIPALIAQVLLFGAVAGAVGLNGIGLDAVGWIVGAACAVIANLALAHGLSRYRAERLGPADWVTLARATLAFAIAAVIAASLAQPAPVTMLVSLSALALVLDAVDGWVARRTGTTATLGAHFDGEVDAFLIFILSVYVARSIGLWVLAIGVARYAFLAAGWPLPWLRRTLPSRYWRKVVTASQGIALTVAIAGVLPRALTAAVVLIALALLGESFGRDVWWLWRRRHDSPGAAQPVLSPTAGHARWRRARSRVGAVFTILAGVLVWVALVAPDQPRYLTPSAFIRLPLEGLVMIALAAVLPSAGRRLLAGAVGVLLGPLVILKILDIGFFTTFDRPFHVIGDSGNAAVGVETLRAAVGRTEADLVVVGVVLGAVALLVLTTLAALRLSRAAADHRHWTLRTVAALGAVWVLCWAFGAQLIARTPIASTSAAGFVIGEVGTVRSDIHDAHVFAGQISHDSLRNTPTAQLLSGLRGKDVLLVFVESYGQVSVQGSSFSPAIDTVLNTGTSQLRGAGFSARSAFVNAPGFGGISWLAHSTLQSGVWANTQRRYDQLIATKRFTLNDAFRRAGWRTINFAPADDRPWPQGSSFYHYDKLYDRRDMGYRGPSFNYAPMPDQYMFAALQRLELAKAHRRPLFAEVDTVSSHMPWDRIPRMIPWNDLGNGSIFNRLPMDREPSSFWWHPNQVKAAYARSLEYSLHTLVSFVAHYGKKNLVLIVVGDEQPLPIVSGQGVSHNVPISVIARDSSVLKRIGGWGWQSGLLPSPRAPVWPMSAFRDRFLTAFDSPRADR
jgi:phosphatidylglycerophosphate synthase